LVQQNESWLQIASTQEGLIGGVSHSVFSAGPTAQSECRQAPWLSPQARLPQMVRASWMHWESQELLQQNESASQMIETQGSQADSSATPVPHLSWAQESPHNPVLSCFRGPAEPSAGSPSP
jgi:hypothetical protein